MVRLVTALPLLQSTTARPLTLIGGLAVMARLSAPHRATADVDTAVLVSSGQPSTLELLLQERGVQQADTAGVSFPTPRGPVKVDVVDVGRWEAFPLPEDPNDALYALAHLWAIDSAAPVTLRATSDGSRRPRATAVIPTATPGPLVAAKLQSAINRGRDKEATDLGDIVSLLQDSEAGPTALAQLAEATPALKEAAAVHVRLWFFDQAARTSRKIRSRPEAAHVSLDTMRAIGSVLMQVLDA